jgi:hypothetical protein
MAVDVKGTCEPRTHPAAAVRGSGGGSRPRSAVPLQPTRRGPRQSPRLREHCRPSECVKPHFLR